MQFSFQNLHCIVVTILKELTWKLTTDHYHMTLTLAQV